MKRLALYLAKRLNAVSLFTVLAAVALTAAGTSAMVPEQVKVETGAVEGVTGTVHPTVRIFKGIPFAAPPVGENRWKAPQPAAKWDGVFKANAFGPSCIAAGGPGRGGAAPPPRARRPRLRPPPRR